MRLARLLPALLMVLATTLPAQAQTVSRDWFVFLETGRKTPDDIEAVRAMQRGHIANFEKRFAEGRLFAAGPLRDPGKHKRGIVVVRAASMEEVRELFQPDEYVREGYLSLNAHPAIVHKGLNTEGLDPKKMEEVRIIQISRPTDAQDAATTARSRAFLHSLLAQAKVGAWYALESGPLADVLFVNTQDTAALELLFANHPDVLSGASTVAIWGQWFVSGVVR